MICDWEAAARAVSLKLLSEAPNVTPRMQAIATKFTEPYQLYRDQEGFAPLQAYHCAAEETETWARQEGLIDQPMETPK